MNNNISSSKRTRSGYTDCIAFIIFLFAVNFQSCAPSWVDKVKEEQSQEWQTVKMDKSETPNWVIYAQKVRGTSFLAYKIEGKIDAPPLSCSATFKNDIYKLINDKTNKKYPIYELVEESENSLLTYVVHNEPFPFKNTEMSVRYHFYENDDGSVGVKWKEAWDESSVQPSKKLKRVETFRGTWDFIPTTDGNTQAVNTVSFDPEKMPLWLVEPMVIKFLKNSLKDIRANTAKESFPTTSIAE